MKEGDSPGKNMAISLVVATIVASVLGVFYWIRLGGTVELWTAVLGFAGVGLLAAGILSVCDLRLALKKRQLLTDGFGNAWMSPWCRVYDEASEGLCFVKPIRPLRLPEELGLEPVCVAQHKTLNSHYVLVHLKANQDSGLERLVTARMTLKRSLKSAFGGNSLRTQIGLLLLEGSGLAQPELLASLVDDFGVHGVTLLWVAGVDPGSRNACLAISPLAQPSTKTAFVALCAHLTSAGYSVEVFLKEKQAFFKVAEALAVLHGGNILR
jgi:hypothetical protein